MPNEIAKDENQELPKFKDVLKSEPQLMDQSYQDPVNLPKVYPVFESQLLE